MFQHLFGKWKVWQVLVLVMLVAGTVVITATIALAGMACESPASVTARSVTAPPAAGPDAPFNRLALSRADHRQP